MTCKSGLRGKSLIFVLFTCAIAAFANAEFWEGFPSCINNQLYLSRPTETIHGSVDQQMLQNCHLSYVHKAHRKWLLCHGILPVEVLAPFLQFLPTFCNTSIRQTLAFFPQYSSSRRNSLIKRISLICNGCSLQTGSPVEIGLWSKYKGLVTCQERKSL